MRNFSVFSGCCFTRAGVSIIADSCGLLTHSLTGNNIFTVLMTLNADARNDYVFIHIQSNDDVIGFLRVIQGIINSVSPPRVIVMVDNVHAPTLALLRAMNVRFILYQRESLSNFSHILHCSTLSHYMSTELYTVIKNTLPMPVWATEWGPFDGVQHLTPTETEVILDLLQGMSVVQMSLKRFVSVKTISTHKHNALRKMGLKGLNEFFI